MRRADRAVPAAPNRYNIYFVIMPSETSQNSSFKRRAPPSNVKYRPARDSSSSASIPAAASALTVVLTVVFGISQSRQNRAVTPWGRSSRRFSGAARFPPFLN